MTTRLLTIICLAIATLLQTLPASAEETAATYPSRTIKIIATFAPGATTDKLARIIANHMHAKWGQTVIVENRAGASGTVGTTALASSTGDDTSKLTFQPVTQEYFASINPIDIKKSVNLLPVRQSVVLQSVRYE